MITHDDTQASSNSPLEKLALSLQDESTNKHKKASDIKEAYPTLEQHLTRKVPFKIVLAKFNSAYGHGIHPPAFRKLLEAERKRRAEDGTVAVCAACGQPMKSETEGAAQLGTADKEDQA